MSHFKYLNFRVKICRKMYLFWHENWNILKVENKRKCCKMRLFDWFSTTWFLNSLQFDKFFYPSDFPMIIALRHNSQVHHLLKQQINHDKTRRTFWSFDLEKKQKRIWENCFITCCCPCCLGSHNHDFVPIF